MDSYFYAYVKDNECNIYEDGIAIIEWWMNAIDKKRTFLQKINDFELNELVASFIAIVLVIVFVSLLLFSGVDKAKEILPLFSMVLGYYFGQSKK